MTNDLVIVRHHVTYGRHYYYPENDAARRVFVLCNSTGKRKAFTLKQLEDIRNMGYQVEIQKMETYHPHE